MITDIKQAILNKLQETKINYNVRIPLAIESGSRGWGVASPDSDYDCRFVYVHKKDWYVSVLEKKDIIEYAADKVFDVNGWDLRKVLQHIMKSNAVMHEWLSSNQIYIKNTDIAALLQKLADDFFNPIAVTYHYLSIAKNKLHEILSEEEGKLKTYFYILRPIANMNYIYQHNKMPYMEYAKTLSEIEMDTEIYSTIRELTALKSVNDERYRMKHNQHLINYFHQEVSLFEERLKTMKFEKNREYAVVDEVFKTIIEKSWPDEPYH